MKQVDYVNRRLRPLRSMPEFYTLRHLLSKVTEIVSVLERSQWTPPIRVLDAGAGCGPYRQLFSNGNFRYVAVDCQTLPGVSVVADAQRLPFADGVFDLVLSNQVLEHVCDPNTVSAELKRIVSDRGYLLLSCPFVWEIHCFPADYWRFSSQALQLLFADMDLVYMEPSTNTAQCLAQTFNLFINRNLENELVKALLFRFTNSRLVVAGIAPEDELLPANYVMVAKRKVPVETTIQISAVRQPSDTRARTQPGLPLSDPGRFRMRVDTPSFEIPVKGPRVKVSGWIAGDSPMDQVWARVDGSEQWTMECNLPRVDVWRAFPEFGNAHRSGFQGECSMGLLSPGEHTLEILATAKGEALAWDPIKFRVTGRRSQVAGHKSHAKIFCDP
ncbi:MAG: class I SAM-dependent methyltransferase [Acidobacteria bacterium]|nr:class I SAM-dependent methyltransferase [Acidobacteriota bacterium]